MGSKYNIINLIPASQCFFKHKTEAENKEAITPVICWALAETKDTKNNTATRNIVGIYIDDGNLCVCEDNNNFKGYSHRANYQLVINN